MRYNLIKMILRGVTLLFTIILTGLIGNVIATNIDAPGSATAAVNFIMFVIVVSWIVGIIGMVSFFASAVDNPKIQLPLDGVASLFSTIAAIVLAGSLRAVDCGDIRPKKMPSDWIAWGSDSDSTRCRKLQASTVFMWFLAVCFCGSLALTVRDARSKYGSIRSASRPSMSQIGSQMGV